MRLTSFNNRDVSKGGESTCAGILHDFTMKETDDGVSVHVSLRHGGAGSQTATFTADDFDDAWDYAEAFERGLTRELATTGIHGYIARQASREVKLISSNFASFSHDGKTPDTDNYGVMETRGRKAENGPTIYDNTISPDPVPAEIPASAVEHLTWQADQAARDALLSERKDLHFDEAAGVIGRFLERSGLGAVETEFRPHTQGKIPLPMLGKGTQIELCTDDKGANIWKLHDPGLKAEFREKYENKAYDPPQGALNVASLYTLHAQIDALAEQRGAGGWAYERYFADMARAASNLKAEVNEITNPDKPLTLPGEDAPKEKAETSVPLTTRVNLGQLRR